MRGRLEFCFGCGLAIVIATHESLLRETRSIRGFETACERRPSLAENLSLSNVARELPALQRRWFGSCPTPREPNVRASMLASLFRTRKVVTCGQSTFALLYRQYEDTRPSHDGAQ